MSAAIKLEPTSTNDSLEGRAAALAEGLYPHQVEGVAFLLGRERGILADDMGLGKTRQAIVSIREAAPAGPWLVVCPASVKYNWAREIACVDSAVDTHIVSAADPVERDFTGWVIINYDIIGRQRDTLAPIDFAGVVLDEAHYIKDHRSARSRHVRELLDNLNGRRPVYLLTGTPITNRPRDLYPLLNVIGHPMAKSFLSFAKRYCAAVHNGFGWDTSGASNLEELSEQLHGVLLRRTKDEVLDLPPKTRTWLDVEVSAGTAAREVRHALLDLTRSRLKQRLGQGGTDAVTAARDTGADRTRLIAGITRARKKLAKAKIKSTIDLAEGVVAQGEKALIFSCFDEPIQKIAEHFGDAAVVVTGSTAPKKRQQLVDRFQGDPTCQVFVANIIAGGVGLNLTAARHVIFNDLDWVPANHWQAEDRAYRIGQTATVSVHYLVARQTIDEFVSAVLEAKSSLVSAVVNREAIEGGAGDVLAALEEYITTLSPRLADTSVDQLSDADLELMLREAAQAYKTRHGSSASDGQLASEAPTRTRALAALMASLEGPSVEKYRVTSNSRPGLYYVIEVTEGEALCGCPGFEYRGACSHARRLKKALVNGSGLPAGYELLDVRQVN